VNGAAPSLPPEAWERLERVLERFEHAWEQGQRPALDDFLADAQAERRALLIELVHEDLKYRLEAGQAVRVPTGYQIARQIMVASNRAGVTLTVS
jgi:hypothetical protein